MEGTASFVLMCCGPSCFDWVQQSVRLFVNFLFFFKIFLFYLSSPTVKLKNNKIKKKKKKQKKSTAPHTDLSPPKVKTWVERKKFRADYTSVKEESRGRG